MLSRLKFYRIFISTGQQILQLSLTRYEIKLIHFVSFIAFFFYGHGEITGKDDTGNLKNNETLKSPKFQLL